MDKEEILDLGDTANMPKTTHNTSVTALPPSPGNTVHIDIICGSGTAINGIRYVLFAVDKCSCHKCIYPMRNLKSDIITPLEQLLKDIGKPPTILCTDFDSKLIGKSILQFFAKTPTIVESAPHMSKMKMVSAKGTGGPFFRWLEVG